MRPPMLDLIRLLCPYRGGLPRAYPLRGYLWRPPARVCLYAPCWGAFGLLLRSLVRPLWDGCLLGHTLLPSVYDARAGLVSFPLRCRRLYCLSHGVGREGCPSPLYPAEAILIRRAAPGGWFLAYPPPGCLTGGCRCGVFGHSIGRD